MDLTHWHLRLSLAVYQAKGNFQKKFQTMVDVAVRRAGREIADPWARRRALLNLFPCNGPLASFTWAQAKWACDHSEVMPRWAGINPQAPPPGAPSAAERVANDPSLWRHWSEAIDPGEHVNYLEEIHGERMFLYCRLHQSNAIDIRAQVVPLPRP